MTTPTPLPESAALTPNPLPESAALTIETVERVHHWNEHLFSFALSRPASFRFRSGEFIMLGLHDGRKPLLRAYSIASPSYDEQIEFLSIKVENGPLTSRLQKIVPGDQVYLGKKPVGTLVADALLPGKRLFLLSTGTGLAPFMSVARDPDIYDRFDEVIVVHSVRRVNDLAYREMLESRLADDPLVGEEAATRFHYVPTVTREPFHTSGRIDALIEDGTLFKGVSGPAKFDPFHDRIMMCGSNAMIHDMGKRFEAMGFDEGSNAQPGAYVIEKAFVG